MKIKKADLVKEMVDLKLTVWGMSGREEQSDDRRYLTRLGWTMTIATLKTNIDSYKKRIQGSADFLITV